MIEISTDKAKATVRVDAEMTAHELQTLVSQLAAARSKMTPEVAKTPHEDLEVEVTKQPDPDLQMKLLRDGRIRVWLRHNGYGWIPFDLPVRNAIAVREYLIANTPDDETGATFFSEEDPGGDRSH